MGSHGATPDPTLVSDVVIVVPGIMGSELRDAKGNPLWSIGPGGIAAAIRTLGDSLQRLELPAGIGDNSPGDGVVPTALLNSLHVIPGLWTPVTGYDVLLDFLRSSRFHFVEPDPRDPDVIPNLLTFPYDWRLSNRFNGRRLARVAGDALERWRSQPGMEDARLVLICHSMGGLIARWFLEQEGGRELVRALITIGTPFRGSVKALDTLVNGLEPGIGRLRVSLTAFARSLPSLHQLLPQYNCIDAADGSRIPLEQAAVPELSASRLQDAIEFHKSIASTASRPYRLHKVVGIRQPTLTTAAISAGGVRTFTSIDGLEQGGDGTVPRLAAEPEDGRGTEVHAVARQHGELQAAGSVLDFLDGILTGEAIIWQDAREPEGFGIDLPDYLPTGQSITLRVTGMKSRLLATLRDEYGKVVCAAEPVPAGGVLTFPAVPECGYVVTVESATPLGPAPVSKPLVVLDPQ